MEGIQEVVEGYKVKYRLDGGYIKDFKRMSFWQKPIYIFDLDGTLADLTHRLHYISGEKKDWKMFFDACYGDTPIRDIVNLYNKIAFPNLCEMWIVSGRNSSAAWDTVIWLKECGIQYNRLFMRSDGDFRPDHVLKEEWLNSLPELIRNHISCVFEDRKSVVDMWRRNGITCCQVADGDF